MSIFSWGPLGSRRKLKRPIASEQEVLPGTLDILQAQRRGQTGGWHGGDSSEGVALKLARGTAKKTGANLTRSTQRSLLALPAAAAAGYPASAAPGSAASAGRDVMLTARQPAICMVALTPTLPPTILVGGLQFNISEDPPLKQVRGTMIAQVAHEVSTRNGERQGGTGHSS
ncbi:hypothetical protein CB1_000623011 [Camelus ferus]|nr:hypothetical protein CB1_000623011 [Camelus ferus]